VTVISKLCNLGETEKVEISTSPSHSEKKNTVPKYFSTAWFWYFTSFYSTGFNLFMGEEKGPAADATDAPQPWGL
jgi:hypothetical protein